MGKYKSYDDCTVEDFKECLNGNYDVLVLSGIGDPKKLAEIWYTVYDQYTANLNTKTNNVAFTLKKRAHTLGNEKLIISTCLFIVAELIKANIINLEDVHVYDDFIKVITNYGFKFDDKKPSESLKKLQKQLKNYDTRIVSQLKKIEEIDQRSEKWAFDDTIASVEKYMHFQIDEEKTTIKKFVSYLNQILNTDK